MKLATEKLGEIEYSPEQVIIFEEGLPGFGYLHEFIWVDCEAEMFFYLQSTEDPELTFVVMDVLPVLDYDPQIDPEQIEELGEGEIETYNIAVVPEDWQQISVNLKAPILINRQTGRGKQVVARNEEYGVRHLLFTKEIKK